MTTKQIVRKAVEKAVREVYKEHYPMHRRGAFDFPDEEEWVKEQVKMFKRNFPELLGFHQNKDDDENN